MVQSAVLQLPSSIFSEEAEENLSANEEEGKVSLTEEEKELMENTRKDKETPNSEAESCENLKKIDTFKEEDPSPTFKSFNPPPNSFPGKEEVFY